MNLSLTSLIRQLDIRESYLHCTLDCYKKAIASVHANLVITDQNLRLSISSRLERLWSSITPKMPPETLRSTAVRLDGILQEYRTQEEAVYQDEQFQVRRTIIALESLVKTLSEQESEHSAKLSGVLQGLEAALFEGDLAATHRTLQDQIRKLRTCLITLSEDCQARDARFQEHMSALRTQAEPVLAEDHSVDHDPGTDIDATLHQYVSKYTLFCVLLVKITDLASIARYWNSECRAKLLLSVENRLSQTIGPSDRLHSYGEDAFLIVMRSTLTHSLENAGRIKEALSLSHSIKLPHGTAKISVGPSIGVVEYIPGEDVASLRARVEAELSRQPGDAIAELEVCA